MFLERDTLDDLMYNVLNELLKESSHVEASKGKNSEIFGVLLKLTNPLARISRSESKGKPFSSLGELMWYLSGSDSLEFIEHYITLYSKYSDDGTTVNGAYGPRIFKMHGRFNQLENIINLLTQKPHSRRAVIQLFDAGDLITTIDVKSGKEKYFEDIPCTCFLQFTVRDHKLTLFTSMRSNDAYLGLPHDIFCFTIIQELVARSLGIGLGPYYHSVSSLHLYEGSFDKARKYIDEGLQSSKFQMPSMPDRNPWGDIEILKSYEAKIRNNEEINFEEISLDKYWLDYLLLLKIHALYKNGKINEIHDFKSKVTSDVYKEYIDKKILDGMTKFVKK